MIKITLLVMGHKMPAWVNEGMSEFMKRLKEFCTFTLLEIPLERRGKSTDLSRILEKEKNLLQSAIPSGSRLIALDIQGESFSSEGLSLKLAQLQHLSSHLCFIIGGPEGLMPEVLSQCHEKWSLSKLTLPHTLARILLVETLYRAFSILANHPYHK